MAEDKDQHTDKKDHEEKGFDGRLLRRIVSFLIPYKGWVALAFVLVMVTAFLGPLRPKLVQIAIDDYIVTGDLDGMLFVWDEDTASAFHMTDTLIPLDIAFFSVGGGLVDRLIMEPCTADPCPLYSAAGLFGLYRYALEAPAGDLEFVTADSTLVIDN